MTFSSAATGKKMRRPMDTACPRLSGMGCLSFSNVVIWRTALPPLGKIGDRQESGVKTAVTSISLPFPVRPDV